MKTANAHFREFYLYSGKFLNLDSQYGNNAKL